MRKKLLSFVLATAMMFSLVACGTEKEPKNNGTTNDSEKYK